MFEAQTAFAHQIADASGELILKYFRRLTDVSDKADASPVTEADKSSERLMRNMIERYFPATALSAKNTANKMKMRNLSGCLTRLTGRNLLLRAYLCSER